MIEKEMDKEERNIERIKRFRLTANVGNRTFHNGVEYVDLGLPSGTKWATTNVGAESIEDCGLYFKWGEKQGYTKEQIGNNEKKFCEDFLNPSGNNMQDVGLDDDAAHFNLGGNWRLPKIEEFSELKFNTGTKIVEINGIKGCALISKKNVNKWIFIPFCGFVSYKIILGAQSYGFLWSSSSADDGGISLSINDRDFYVGRSGTFYGQPCRGVFK